MLKRNAPSVARVEKLISRPQGRNVPQGQEVRAGADDYNAAAIRESLRVFMGTAIGLKAWAVIGERLLGRERRL